MMSGWIQEPMEPIPEEGTELDGSEWGVCSESGSSRRTVRKKEVYTSEQINTLVSTVPKDTVPEEWLVENQVVDPEMATSYLTESLAGPTSARGSSYTYSYESHYDNPPEEEYEQIVNADGLHQMQKVTRVTKVTTTRSVRQVPVTSPYSNIDFDSSGLPTPSPGREMETDDFINRLNGEDSEDRAAPPPAPPLGSRYAATHEDSGIPSAPGVPDIMDTAIGEVTVVWSAPLHRSGDGIVRGYQLQMRELPDGEWEDMGVDQLIKDTTCRVTNLTSQEVQFRVSAYGRTGFGPPSNPSLPVKIPISEADLATCAGAPLAPGRPVVIAVDGQGALIEWTAPVADVHSSPPQGYQVEYRVYGSRDWIVANETLVSDTMFTVENLRPNGVYEFRVRGKNADGLGHASISSGAVAIKPAAPQRSIPARPVSQSIQPPGQPQMVEAGDDWVKLEWAPSTENACYVVEYREVGDPIWHTANYDPIVQNGIQVEGLRRNSTYEFCVISVIDGMASVSSEPSDIIHLRPMGRASSLRVSPEMTRAPEFFEIDGDKITICWMPAHSSLPVTGYDVEFRDLQQDDRWYKVNDQPVFACKMTVGDLIIGHDYQFRVIAHNAAGSSQPSPSSPFVHIEENARDQQDIIKYVEAERFGAVPLLQEEMVRESPPLPERDDSPPPLRRANNNVQWRDPSLKEVIEYLSSSDKDKQLNASGYLQHLTFSDNLIKEETREYGGIPKLIKLLKSDVPRIQKNACACLKNLSYGKENDTNKMAILDADGVRLLSEVLRTTHDASVKEEATAALWNLSSADHLKPVILDASTDILCQQIATPSSSTPQQNGTTNGVDPSKHFNSAIFKNSTGVLRNISAASQNARRKLRDIPNLIEALVNFLTHAIQKNQVDSPTVENVVCVLRNLSYRIQEVVDPNYDPANAHYSNSKSSKMMSPKPKKKEKEKDKKKNAKNPKNIVSGPAVLWQPYVVKLYLKLLQDSSNIDTLEASAGSIQNLAACQFPPSAEVRAAVRVEKGLPVLVELIRLPEDFVVCAVATALRNLSIDSRNRELIGKYALRDLLDKLPEAGARRPPISDQTIGAILGILFEVVRSSASFTKDVHELKGTDKLRALSRAYPTYSHRVCKYASQVLYVMWQHKELHDGFKRSGLKEADFYSGTARRGDSSTLARPISSQGRERPAQQQQQQLDDTMSSGGYGSLGPIPSSARPPSATSQTIQRRYDQVPREAVYSSVRKGSPRGVDDSWV